jgi:pimeloyl-ACP methyl ester carboxylesterase
MNRLASVSHVDDLRGLGKLAVDATNGVTDLVQAMQSAIGGTPARLLSAPAYATVRGITSLVGGTLDRALAHLAPLVGDGNPSPEREALLAALNGVLGDYLTETKNPLAIEMRLRRTEGAPQSPRIVVFIHGSSMTRRAWQAAHDVGYAPVHLDYNTGLHVSTNGRAFDAQLETFIAEWPVPVEEIAIVGHSMGGLVARSACYYAENAKHAWREKLRAMVFLGTPHHGAPLERAGNWVETLLGVTPYSAPFARLGRIRSAGVTDLRFGNVIDEHWQGSDRFGLGIDARTPVPLPMEVDCYAIAAENDGLVPLSSALGEHPNPTLTLEIPPSHRFVATGIGHIELLRGAEVWERIERWLHACRGRVAHDEARRGRHD